MQCNSRFRKSLSSSGLVLGFASSLAKAIKLVLRGCIVKPFARFLVDPHPTPSEIDKTDRSGT